jgi:hypothetical protein
MGLMSWGIFPDGRTGLSSLLDPLLESSHDLLCSRLCSTLFWGSSSLDPLLESFSLSQSMAELLPGLGQLSLCHGCVLSVCRLS